jgi:TRAP-type mannitol/chloroaromatic compound transport system substrate-binding protein
MRLGKSHLTAPLYIDAVDDPCAQPPRARTALYRVCIMLGVAVAAWLAAMADRAFGEAAGQPRLTIDIVSTFPPTVPILGDAARGLTDRTRRASNGEVVLRFSEPLEWGKAVVTLQEVGKGNVQAAWAGSAWLVDVDSAFGMFYAVPFGPPLGEYLAWLYRGGGLQIADDLFKQRGIHAIPCVLLPPSGAGWFRRPVNSMDDLRGMRVRSFGLGEKVLQKVGAQTRGFIANDILNAMRNSEVDAVELLLPAIDRTFNFHTVASYYYFPSWHKQSTIFHLYVNKTLWDGYADRDRALVETACNEAMMQSLVAGEALQAEAMRELKSKGVQLRRFAPEVLLGLEKAWQEVAAEESAKNANFKRVYESYTAFRENNAVWRYFAPLQ